MNSEVNQSRPEVKVRVEYSKTCQSRYIAHLDTIDVICKALRRLQLPYAVTQGCHVRPKISFGPPLPLGHASYCEYFVLVLTEPVDSQKLQESLNRELPSGMRVISIINPYVETRKGNFGERLHYRFSFTHAEAAETARQWLLNPETSFSAESKGKTRTYMIKSAILGASIADNDSLILEADFIQGQADVPSVSKIVTALAGFLDTQKDCLKLIERVSLSELQQKQEISAN